MVFDVISFIAGVAAGALTGGLAGLLHSLERTASIQERLRVATQKLDQITSKFATNTDSGNARAKSQADELQRELDEIHEEIKRMYKRTSR